VTELADQAFVDDVLGAPGARQRRAMAKAITLLESTREEHRVRADALLHRLLPYSGRAFRLGISGVPGVGKSTFIEALGLWLIARGHRVAVLAVDPSSSISGGSILGDKTRMEQLSVQAMAFIRPSRPRARWVAWPRRHASRCWLSRLPGTTSSSSRPSAWARARRRWPA
jgi:LAO/AO transport system kinase